MLKIKWRDFLTKTLKKIFLNKIKSTLTKTSQFYFKYSVYMKIIN